MIIIDQTFGIFSSETFAVESESDGTFSKSRRGNQEFYFMEQTLIKYVFAGSKRDREHFA
jgi:hypothetical protein